MSRMANKTAGAPATSDSSGDAAESNKKPFDWSMVAEVFKQPYPLTASVVVPILALVGLTRS